MIKMLDNLISFWAVKIADKCIPFSLLIHLSIQHTRIEKKTELFGVWIKSNRTFRTELHPTHLIAHCHVETWNLEAEPERDLIYNLHLVYKEKVGLHTTKYADLTVVDNFEGKAWF